MSDGANAGPPATLEEAYQDAAIVQRRYFTAVRDQGNATPRLSLGLIGLSAIALFKGMTNPNTNDLIAMGVAGSAAYAAGNTLLSTPRLDVYRAGGEALGCAMAAVEPLRIGARPEVLGSPADAESADTLYGRTYKLVHARDDLQGLLITYRPLIQSRDVPDAAPRQVPVVPRACKPLPANPTAVEKLENQQCRRESAELTTRSVSPLAGATGREAPPASLERLVIEAQEWIKAADEQIALAHRGIGTLNAAASALWQRSVAIQKVVSEEVGKTVPNLAAVMAAAKGIRATGLSITGSDAFKPTGDAQTGTTKRRLETTEDKNAIKALSTAIDKLKLARRDLSAKLQFSLGSGHDEVRAQLNACSVKISGVALTVTPGGDNLQVALDGSVLFFVSGGSGVPRGSIDSNPKGATLTSRSEGGLNLFEFKPSARSAVDEVYTLRFTDARGEGEHVVVVRIVPAAKTQTKPPKPGAESEDKANTQPRVLGAVGRDNGARTAST